MQILEVAFFGYSVTDIQRARDFYEGVLGLKAARVMGSKEEGWGWIEYDIGSTTLAIASGMGENWKPNKGGGTVAFEVKDFNEAMESLKKAKTVFHHEAFETPVCHMAIVSDPDGNAVTIHKRK